MIRQQLQRNFALQLGVERAKHHAHSAFTKARLHEKWTNACANGKRQFVLFLQQNGEAFIYAATGSMQER